MEGAFLHARQHPESITHSVHLHNVVGHRLICGLDVGLCSFLKGLDLWLARSVQGKPAEGLQADSRGGPLHVCHCRCAECESGGLQALLGQRPGLDSLYLCATVITVCLLMFQPAPKQTNSQDLLQQQVENMCAIALSSLYFVIPILQALVINCASLSWTWQRAGYEVYVSQAPETDPKVLSLHLQLSEKIWWLG